MKINLVRLVSTIVLLFAFVQTSLAQEFTFKVALGQKVTMIAEADGTPPFRYLWYKNGVATSVTDFQYVIGAAEPSDTATYSVEVSNEIGSAKSPNVICRVLVMPKQAIDTYEILSVWTSLRREIASVAYSERLKLGASKKGGQQI